MTIYIAFYKGRGGKWWQRLQDSLIRFFTRGAYSHCEIAVAHTVKKSVYECVTASPRDGGVRYKEMPLPSEKWDFVALEPDRSVVDFYNANRDKKYDWLGVLGFVLPTRQNPNRYFCSEYVAEFLGFPQAWRFSPNDLYAILNKRR